MVFCRPITKLFRGSLNKSDSKISREDWEGYAKSLDEFEYVKETETWVWKSDKNSCLWYSNVDGEVWTKNPSEEFIRFLVGIAQGLKAVVRGGEGEYWRSMDDVFFIKDGIEVSWDQAEEERVNKLIERKAKKRQEFKLGLLKVLIGLVLGLVVFWVLKA